jgi:hypothetical protein
MVNTLQCILPIVVILGVAAPRRAAADDAPFTIGSRPVWFVLGGITTGGTIALADRGALVGGEVSLARLRDGAFMGVYADGYYDWGAGGTYITGGPELGYKLLSIDGGPALRMANGDTTLGVAGRISVGIGMVSLYGRYAYFDTTTDAHVIQVGLMLKLPIMTIGGR